MEVAPFFLHMVSTREESLDNHQTDLFISQNRCCCSSPSTLYFQPLVRFDCSNVVEWDFKSFGPHKAWLNMFFLTWEVMEYSRELHWLTLYGGTISSDSGSLRIKSSNLPLPPRSYSMALSVSPNPRGKAPIWTRRLGQMGLVAVYPWSGCIIQNLWFNGIYNDSGCFFVIGNKWIFWWQMFGLAPLGGDWIRE